MGKDPLWGQVGAFLVIKPEEAISNTAGFPVNSNLCLQHQDHLIRTSLLSLLGHQDSEPVSLGRGQGGTWPFPGDKALLSTSSCLS